MRKFINGKKLIPEIFKKAKKVKKIKNEKISNAYARMRKIYKIPSSCRLSVSPRGCKIKVLMCGVLKISRKCGTNKRAYQYFLNDLCTARYSCFSNRRLSGATSRLRDSFMKFLIKPNARGGYREPLLLTLYLISRIVDEKIKRPDCPTPCSNSRRNRYNMYQVKYTKIKRCPTDFFFFQRGKPYLAQPESCRSFARNFCDINR